MDLEFDKMEFERVKRPKLEPQDTTSYEDADSDDHIVQQRRTNRNRRNAYKRFIKKKKGLKQRNIMNSLDSLNILGKVNIIEGFMKGIQQKNLIILLIFRPVKVEDTQLYGPVQYWGIIFL